MARAVSRSAVVKGPNAFRTISEAAETVGAPQHVLRFWETKFPFVTPVKRAGGRRFYRPQDVEVLKAIRRLLHEDGLTIKGVQRLHREQGLKALVGVGLAENFEEASKSSALEGGTAQAEELARILAVLEQAKVRLDGVLAV